MCSPFTRTQVFLVVAIIGAKLIASAVPVLFARATVGTAVSPPMARAYRPIGRGPPATSGRSWPS